MPSNPLPWTHVGISVPFEINLDVPISATLPEKKDEIGKAGYSISFRRGEAYSSYIADFKFPVCPICYKESRPLGAIATKYRPSIGLYACKDCFTFIENNMTIRDFLIGVCSISGILVSAPFSIISRKPVMDIFRQKLDMKWPVIDIHNGLEKDIDVTFDTFDVIDTLWTINLPVTIIYADLEFLISSFESRFNCEFYIKRYGSLLASVSMDSHLYFEGGRYVLRSYEVVCSSCGSEKVGKSKNEEIVHCLTTKLKTEYGFLLENLTYDAPSNFFLSKTGLGNHQDMGDIRKGDSYYSKRCYFSPENIKNIKSLARYNNNSLSIYSLNPDFLKYAVFRTNEGSFTLANNDVFLEKSTCPICQRSRKTSDRKVKKICVTCHKDYWTDKDSSKICKVCNANTQSHNFDVMLVLKTKSLSRRLKPHSVPLGVELEIYSGSSPKEIKDFISEEDTRFVFKWDGSIDMQRGVEIVSSPLLYQEHIEAKGWDIVFSPESKLMPSSKCGMHVHVPKASMVGEKICIPSKAIQDILYSPDNRKYVEFLSGRPANNIYAPFDGAHYRDGARYTGLNFLTHSKKTVEYRIFRSPITFYEFKRNLQFVDAFTTFIRTFSTSKHMKWVEEDPSRYFYVDRLFDFKVNGFFDFVDENRVFYPSLYEDTLEFMK